MIRNLFPKISYICGEGLELKKITRDDADALRELVTSENVYRYEPTFLFERKYDDVLYVIDHLYDECLEESVILGVFADGDFCGLAEFYGYVERIHKISIGCRLLERCWGKGIATRVAKLMTDHLLRRCGIEIITASSLPQNKVSANVLKKAGFTLVASASDEDWGYTHPLPTDKWIM